MTEIKIKTSNKQFYDVNIIKTETLELKENEELLSIEKDGQVVWKAEDVCEHCKMNKALRNPSGICDHLYYPMYCSVCKYNKKAEEPKEHPNRCSPECYVEETKKKKKWQCLSCFKGTWMDALDYFDIKDWEEVPCADAHHKIFRNKETGKYDVFREVEE